MGWNVINRYLYALNDPVSHTDPSGLLPNVALPCCNGGNAVVTERTGCFFDPGVNNGRYAETFVVAVFFQKPCCECCEFRQYISGIINYGPVDKDGHPEHVRDWIYEQIGPPPYFIKDGAIGDRAGGYSLGSYLDDCTYRYFDSPGKNNIKGLLDRNPIWHTLEIWALRVF